VGAAEPAGTTARRDGGWIDATRPLRNSIPVWPGDRPFALEQRREPDFVFSAFSTTCHVGTHLDAPLHVDPRGRAVEAVPIERLVGAAEVVHLPCTHRALEPNDLPRGWSPAASRVLVRTDSYPIDGAMDEGFAALSPELAHWLADRGVELVGIDTPSVDLFDSQSYPTHHALAGRGMTWIEGLWLAEAVAGLYELVALPILLEGADGAPVRAILRRVEF
jgi:arylformamidase